MPAYDGKIEHEHYGCLLVADVKEVWDGYTGPREHRYIEIETLTVFVFINDIEYDVTASIPSRTLDGWKDFLRLEYEPNWEWSDPGDAA